MQEKQLRKPYLTPEIVSVVFKVEKGMQASKGGGSNSTEVQIQDPTQVNKMSLSDWQRLQQGSGEGFQTGVDGYLGGEGAYSEGVSGGYFAGNVGGYF